jgi:hypothetical protein
MTTQFECFCWKEGHCKLSRNVSNGFYTFFCSKSCFDHIVLAERIKESLKIIERGDTEITVKSMKGIL